MLSSDQDRQLFSSCTGAKIPKLRPLKPKVRRFWLLKTFWTAMTNLKAVVKFHSDKINFPLFITLCIFRPFLKRNPYPPLDSWWWCHFSFKICIKNVSYNSFKFLSLKRVVHALHRALDVVVYHMTTTPKKYYAWVQGYFQTISFSFCTEQEHVAQKNYLNRDTWLQNRSQKHVNFRPTSWELIENSCA